MSGCNYSYRKRAIHRMDGYNWNRELHLFQRNTVLLKILDHCRRPPEIMTVPLKCMAASAPLKEQYALNKNICQIHCIYEIYGCKYHIH